MNRHSRLKFERIGACVAKPYGGAKSIVLENGKTVWKRFEVALKVPYEYRVFTRENKGKVRGDYALRSNAYNWS